MQNSTLNLENARAPKPHPPGSHSGSAQWAGPAAREKGLQRIEGMKIAQSAMQGIGMSTKEIRGTWVKTPNYALAVSLLFTKATNQSIILGTIVTAKFDGVDARTGEMVDRKTNIVTTDKSLEEARRQSITAQKNGFGVRWEVPNAAFQARAQKFLSKNGIQNIKVAITPR
jgi:hypothetical protein